MNLTTIPSGDAVPSADLEPLFRRLPSDAGANRRRNDPSTAPGTTITGSPFGIESPVLPRD